MKSTLRRLNLWLERQSDMVAFLIISLGFIVSLMVASFRSHNSENVDPSKIVHTIHRAVRIIRSYNVLNTTKELSYDRVLHNAGLSYADGSYTFSTEGQKIVFSVHTTPSLCVAVARELIKEKTYLLHNSHGEICKNGELTANTY